MELVPITVLIESPDFRQDFFNVVHIPIGDDYDKYNVFSNKA